MKKLNNEKQVMDFINKSLNDSLNEAMKESPEEDALTLVKKMVTKSVEKLGLSKTEEEHFWNTFLDNFNNISKPKK